MSLKGLGLKVCQEYILPVVKKIARSLISNIGKSLYERLYSRFAKALASFEEALDKLFEINDIDKLKKRLKCCKKGLLFFEKMDVALNNVLADYNAAITDAEEKYLELGGEPLEDEKFDKND